MFSFRHCLSVFKVWVLCLPLVTVGCMHKGSGSGDILDSDQDLTADVGSRPSSQTTSDSMSMSAKSGRSIAAESSCAEIKNRMCTREYAPVSCIYNDRVISGSNNCEKDKNADLYACEEGVTLAKDGAECFQHLKAGNGRCEEAAEKAGGDCARDMIASVCMATDSKTQKTLKASGQSSCDAKKNLAKIFCLRDSQLSSDAISCSPMAKK